MRSSQGGHEVEGCILGCGGRRPALPVLAPVRLDTYLDEGHFVGDKTVIRRGGNAADFVIKKGWIKTWTKSGEVGIALIQRDMLHLTEGKTSWCLFSATLRCLPSLHEIGAQGISITHYAFDKAMYNALSTKLRQWHLARAPRSCTTKRTWSASGSTSV